MVISGVGLAITISFVAVSIILNIFDWNLTGVGEIFIGIFSVTISVFTLARWSKAKSIDSVIIGLIYSSASILLNQTFLREVINRGFSSILILFFVGPLPLIVVAFVAGIFGQKWQRKHPQ